MRTKLLSVAAGLLMAFNANAQDFNGGLENIIPGSNLVKKGQELELTYKGEDAMGYEATYTWRGFDVDKDGSFDLEDFLSLNAEEHQPAQEGETRWKEVKISRNHSSVPRVIILSYENGTIVKTEFSDKTYDILEQLNDAIMNSVEQYKF